MRIFIPTKGRPLADQHTWHAIANSDGDLITKYKVTLVVQRAEEAYEFLKHHVPAIVSGVAGISAARQFILDYSDDNKVVMLDDDLNSWSTRTADDRFIKDKDSPEEAFRVVEDYLGEYAHGGIGQRQFANNQPLVAHDTRVLRALAYRKDILGAVGARFTLPLMEDFEMTLKLLTRGLSNFAYYGVVQDQAKSHAPGGCTGLRTLQLQDMCARGLAQMFPKYVKVRENVEGWDIGPRTEVSVQWKRARYDR